ncbi:MAG: glutathione S-transferase family protein [Polyangiaceae bacterium]
MQVLFHYPWAPYARKSLLAAYETGAEFEEEITPPFSTEHMTKLRARTYPLATVPLLLFDDGEFLSESTSIVEYLDLEAPGGPSLVPQDPRAALKVRSLDRLAEAILGPTMYLTWALRKPPEKQNSKRLEETLARLDTTFRIYDKMLAGSPFVFGDSFTMADIGPACGISVMLADRSIRRADLDAHPALKRWYERIETRPTWQKMIERADRVPRPAELA